MTIFHCPIKTLEISCSLSLSFGKLFPYFNSYFPHSLLRPCSAFHPIPIPPAPWKSIKQNFPLNLMNCKMQVLLFNFFHNPVLYFLRWRCVHSTAKKRFERAKKIKIKSENLVVHWIQRWIQIPFHFIDFFFKVFWPCCSLLKRQNPASIFPSN